MVIDGNVALAVGIAVGISVGAIIKRIGDAVFLNIVDVEAAGEIAKAPGIVNNRDAGCVFHRFIHGLDALIADLLHRHVGNRLRCFTRRELQTGRRAHGRRLVGISVFRRGADACSRDGYCIKVNIFSGECAVRSQNGNGEKRKSENGL